jgi:hypothetical protein
VSNREVETRAARTGGEREGKREKKEQETDERERKREDVFFAPKDRLHRIFGNYM